ncbi:hemolysin family protein [Jeotgalibacillus sp. R-1-5s-1]|uniref:hemolysin family protein n=1 Tax=Jeotgalibacillus sp. R-1-5s-1 TaxID=2555897 RepID=UPI00106B6ACD|nr:hemolysin family protein [Jeotgalibacillus sp. R-1-5s-1]TFD99956.1 HlyC/CorC family transporter [Jeotgalibacillus sp. R-1-5s-1]
MDILLLINLTLLVVLILATAFFVGSEFAIVKVRMSRVDQLLAEGNKTAVVVKKVVSDLDYYLSACQLGITVTALGLGWLGKPTVEILLYPLFDTLGVPAAVSSVIAFAVAFSVVTFLHVVIGELAPKTLAIQFAEKMTLLLARPLFIFGKIMFPAIWLLNGSARILLRAFGVRPANHEQAHSEEELKIIMAQSFQSGEINQAELAYMENIFSFDERVAKDIMVPRVQMINLDLSMSKAEIVGLVDEYQFTRYPVTSDYNKDEILGFINVKEMLHKMIRDEKSQLTDSMQTVIFVSEQSSLQETMMKMKSERKHLAIVIDEFGGTSGLITLEDILEEIFGEIQDEFDEDERPEIEEKSELVYAINGRVLLDDLQDRFGIQFSEGDEFDTIGGWIQYKHQDTQIGEEVLSDPKHKWTVKEMDQHQIMMVELEIINK